jgi:hypothetical protein
MTLLVEVSIGDLAVPSDPEALPSKGVDAGVLPDDMVDHLRVADVFPVAPTVSGVEVPLQVLGGGRCVWAAEKAGWSRPIRCVVNGRLPRGVAAVSLANIAEAAPTALIHSAAFAQRLTAEMQAEVEQRLTDLAEQLAARGMRAFSRVDDLRWPRPDLVHLVVPNAAGEVGVIGRELWKTFAELARRDIALRAWDGRVLL